ncbi:NAD(P)-dependent alcohol dehydrogenase [Ruicaihuangia caeni]|uniref:NAD(P)-dependent alcohol dehydrogenase n=1 Tax=Ruicaihuangia caeni TaxID=3042517 RepID=UPI00338F58D1
MRAIVQDRYGEADVLRLADIDRPRVSAGQVLVEVRAAGVDPGVWHLMAGKPGLVRLAAGLRRPRWPVRGMAFAGVVTAVGEGVDAFGAGDEVFGTANGSFAEFVLAKPEKIAPKPASLSFEEAAAVPISGPTALQSLRDAVRLQAGQHVLVLGAAGGVGTFAVQLAKAMGARVTGAASGPKLELARSIGADAVIDYTVEDPLAAGPYDAILDMGGARPLAALRAALVPGGAIAIVGAEVGPLGGLSRMLVAPLVTAFSRHRIVGVISIENTADLLELTDYIEKDAVRPALDQVFPLEHAADAIRHIGRGHGTGKTVLSIG